MKQQCPKCKRFMKCEGEPIAPDSLFDRMKAKFPNAWQLDYYCSRCDADYTITGAEVVLSGPRDTEAV